MVAFYNRTVAKPAFDNVGVNRTLNKKVHLADELRLFAENVDKRFAYNFPLFFGLLYAFKPAEE